jgi:hypothetical protein
VSARVVDSAGNPTDVPTRLIVSLGSGADARILPDAVVEWQHNGAGYAGRVQVPRQRAGRDELELRVLATGALTGTRTVALRAGPAKSVRIEADEDLLADGRRRSLRLSLLDAHGNRAEDPGAAPRVTADRGSVSAATRGVSGAYEVEYRSLFSAEDYREVIRAEVGPLQGQTEVQVRAVGGSLVVGPKVGYAFGTGGFSSPTAGLEVGLWTRPLHASFGLVLEGRWYAFDRTDALRVGNVGLQLENEATFLAFRASGGWRRPLLRGMLWVGAGGGMARGWAKTTVVGQPAVGDVGWAPTAHASVGWGPRLGGGVPYAELEAGWQGALSTGPVRGSFESVSLNVGYRFDAF